MQNLPHMQEAHLSVQKFPAGNEMPKSQPVHIKQFGNNGLRDALPEVLPDEILFSAEFSFLGQAAFGSA